MKRFLLLPLLIVLAFFGCKKETNSDNVPTKIEGKRITINDSLASNLQIEAFVKPYREQLNKIMDSVLTFSNGNYSDADGELETPLGNLIADLMYVQGNKVFKARTGEDIDFVLTNHGGIRADLPKGEVTMRHVYQIIPFDNTLYVLDLKGAQIKEMLDYLARKKRAHPIAKLNIKLDKNYNLKNATINNKPIDYSKNYKVLTLDFLYNGGDKMTFFKPSDSVYNLNYLLRNAMIDYFQKIDTIKPIRDNRFIKLEH